MKKSQRGFTLVEILVVIAIIGVLAGMVIGVTGVAQKRAKAAAAQSNISAITYALEAYRAQNGIFPGGQLTGQPVLKDGPWLLFLGLYTANVKIGGSRDNHLSDWPVDQLGVWPGDFREGEGSGYAAPADEALDFSGGLRGGKIVFLDPWGQAINYVEFDSRATGDRVTSHPRTGKQLRGKGGQSYAVWSNGPNMKNDMGKEDDITSWSIGGSKSRPSGGSSGGGN